ncbi:MAG TPA: nickel pincer cofactor biosynthesis protein LarB [Planctomycetota bacterium]|nr:nickel pincer cofactor biosynthesis protein LarB [Planctomycetota bacterium]
MSDDLEKLLESVKTGKTTIEQAVAKLRAAPFAETGPFAKVDHHRAMRCGAPEVIFGLGKAPEDVARIASEILAHGHNLLATRVSAEHVQALRAVAPDLVHEERARCVVVERQARPEPPPGRILVVAAGTSDAFVAEEARVTAQSLGNKVEALYDVGVAGIHRLLRHAETVQQANVLIVCAGMEGALPSVVGGLVDRPVIAVPTSVGYGASFGGLAALLAMLNSCASGILCVNIDNGFGAGYAASLINRAMSKPRGGQA